MLELYLAFLLDLFLGQPSNKFHLVAWLGKGLSILEKTLRNFFNNDILSSIILFIFLHILYILIFMLCIYFNDIIINIILIYFSFSFRGMIEHTYPIYISLKNHNFDKAKYFTQFIVSRIIKDNDDKTIIRSSIESIAENYVDTFISPLFYFLIGYLIHPSYGGFFAFYYRIFNTCDAMFGYKNQKYLKFGFIFARFDDLLNFIPARISISFIFIASFLLKYNYKNCFYIWLRDHKKHPSPNGGNPESAFAGSLEIQLGGINYYFNKKEFRPFLGDKIKQLHYIHILKAIQLFIVSSFLFFYFITGIIYIV
ncbi:MAG: cobalamin biosynthesis protein CobD [Leptospiraceae bacterium]|nr:MAG: cobalamin biosynthesis protein CobD [Leptospiraceae bacterium]